MQPDHRHLDKAREIARRVGVEAPTVLEWAREGLIPCVRVTRKVVRFSWPDVEAALRRHARRRDEAAAEGAR